MQNSFHYTAMAVDSMIAKNIFAKLKPYGLTMGQPKVLEYLREHEGAGNKEIAKACFIEPATLTSVLGRMEKSGLVGRRIPEENRRILEITLTEQGRTMAQHVVDQFEQLEQAAFVGISEQEQAAFMETYKKIQKNLTTSLYGE